MIVIDDDDVMITSIGKKLLLPQYSWIFTNTENWTCVNLVEFYRANSKQKERKKVLDNIKKDLEKVVRSKSGFDATRKKKAQKIINNWKDWTMMSDDTNFKFEFNQIQQQVLTTGNTVTIDNIDNHCVTGKHLREDEMKTTVDVTPLKQVEKLPCEFEIPQTKRPRNVPPMNLQQEAIVDAELTTSDKFQETNTEKAGEAKTFYVSFDKYIGSGVNIQDKSDDIAGSNKDLEDENDEEIKFNLDDISRELQHEPAVKWEVDNINVTDRFRTYQKDILKKVEEKQKKDTVKTHLRARKSINMQLQRKGGPAEAGIFLNMGEWMETFFMDLKTKLVVEKASIPLAEFAISHIIALEERIGKLAEDYKYRDGQNQEDRNDQITPPTSFIRKFPNTPQVKLLFK
ncbi:8638_t:CDS:10 [Paraglomus brasilianum]|uniref:8638_t:CDS:1 n=1 Tax=Paraglomus brasilianum TaxID=144538 RepID=A0A9N9BWK9_9GLOM|nr:8638_t:CDS:10 [Paraglomus brasilianum]